jgi:hypothetical protein
LLTTSAIHQTYKTMMQNVGKRLRVMAFREGGPFTIILKPRSIL